MKKSIMDALIKNYSKESRLEYLRRVTSLSVLVAMLTTSSASVVLAKDTNGVIDKNKTKKVETVKNNTSTEENKNERVEHASTLEEAMVDKSNLEVKSEVNLEKSQPSISALAATTTKYDFNYLNTLNNNELIELLKKIQWNDINGLFQYSSGSATFFGDKNRVQAVMDALEESGRTYTTTDIKGITTLVEVLRAGFYLGFYNEDLSYLNEQSFKDKCIPAMLAIENNPNFKLGTSVQDEVVTSLGKLIGNAYCNHEVVNGAARIMKQFIQGMDVYAGNYAKGTAVHTLMKEIEFAFSNASYNKKPEEMSWYGKIDPFIDELKNLTLYGKVTNDNEWVINNGIFYLSKIGVYANRDKDIKRALTDAMKMYEKYGDQYFNALDRLMLDYNGIDADGNKIDEDQIIKEATKHYLPKTYTFDNGNLIIQAGDKVSEQKIKKLYWASKEVKSQFHRVIGNDKALEQGHVDDVLTMKIFNSPKEYKMNTRLTGISTDNGGIYIEPQGTFYTYERTEQESIYSLEELFRHEFTHYLQCRYLVKGMWGKGPFYENEELTWYDEGTAEFFAGSTRTSGVLPRKSVTSYIPKDASRRYSLKNTVNANYNSGGDVYTYGFAMANYMYAKDMPTFVKINKAILNNDITTYKKYILELGKDQNKNTQYQNYMQSLVDNYHNLTVPLVSEDYLLDHGYKKGSEVYSDITKAASLKNVKVEKENSQFFDTFTLSGTYTGDVSKGEHEDWKAMSKKVDDTLKDLSKNSWSGYKTLTAYFTDYKVTSDNRVQYNVVFHGVLTDKNGNGDENKSPIVKITAPNTATVGKKIQFNSNGTMDEDGQIASYSWNFGDGKTSEEENPVHIFEKEGDYSVTLTVKDDKGASTTEKISVKVDKENPQGEVIEEKEDNGSIEKANLISVNKTVRGGFDYYDSNDYYTFELDTPGKINIEVTKLNSFGANWVLYREGDSSNYISYAKMQGNKLVNDVNLYEGKYHLCVYKTSGIGNYELKISK